MWRPTHFDHTVDECVGGLLSTRSITCWHRHMWRTAHLARWKFRRCIRWVNHFRPRAPHRRQSSSAPTYRGTARCRATY